MPVRTRTTRAPCSSARIGLALPGDAGLGEEVVARAGALVDRPRRAGRSSRTALPLTSVRGRPSPPRASASRRVVSTRLSWISRLRAAVQRLPSIGAPARFTTASAPSSTASGGGPSAGSQRASSAPSMPAAPRRETATTSSPRASSARLTAPPIMPVAPTTATLIARARPGASPPADRAAGRRAPAAAAPRRRCPGGGAARPISTAPMPLSAQPQPQPRERRLRGRPVGVGQQHRQPALAVAPERRRCRAPCCARARRPGAAAPSRLPARSGTPASWAGAGGAPPRSASLERAQQRPPGRAARAAPGVGPKAGGRGRTAVGRDDVVAR